MRLGEFTVDVISAGAFRLDGGAMFGVVPQTLWGPKMPPDSANRIGMALNVLIVRGRGLNLLVDTGAGEKGDEKFRRTYSLSPSTLEAGLAALGLGPGDIHVVLNTHLHFDHAGGNTRRDAAGLLVPAFPNARYLVQRQELEDARAAHERNRASYLPEDFEPLCAAGRLDVLEGEAEIAPGLRAFPLPGHTLGMQGLMIEGGGERGLFLADCVPTSHHVPFAWIMAYDLYPMTTLETKRRLMPLAAKEGWTLFFEHDPDVPAARIEEDPSGRYRVLPLEERRGTP